MPKLGLDAGGITSEFEPKTEILPVLNLMCLIGCFCWFYCILFLFLSSFCVINFIITIFSSLFLPSSLSLLLLCYNPLFSLLTTLSALSYLLSPPVFTSPSNPPPTSHCTTPPSYTLTTRWLAYSANFTQPQPPVIPDTCTLHYNRNISKHTQEPQNLAAPIPLTPLTHSTSHPPFQCHLHQFPKFLCLA
jgi:hypothetical protein